MNIDLHCHSNVSDGVLTPADVVLRAAKNGVTHLALTDHDQLAGLESARETANAQGICLINGVEISVEWTPPQKNEAISIHVVALNIDDSNAQLREGLAAIRQGRQERGHKIAAELAKIGIADAFAGAAAHAAHPELISRSHFARFLVEIGRCRDVKSVFERYLVPGKPGYVPHAWAELADGVAWAIAAGGVAVLAHPGRYRLNQQEMAALLSDFKNAGGQALEVNSGSHTPAHVQQFKRYARDYELHGSIGSDFHAPTESYMDLGRLPPLCASVKPVWDLFLPHLRTTSYH